MEYEQAPKKHSHLPLLIAGLVALLIVILALALTAVYLMIPAYIRVLYATKNTIKEKPAIVSDLSPLMEIATCDEVTYKLTGKIHKNDITAKLMRSGARYQLSIDMDGSQDLGAVVNLDSDALSVYLPDFSKRVIEYNYNKSDPEILTDEYDEDDIKDFKDLLKASLLDIGDIKHALIEAMKVADFEKLSDKTFTVDGKSVSCKGYKMDVSGEFANTFVESLRDSVDDDDFDDWFDDILERADDLEKAKAYFYIYNGKLASLKVVTSNKNIEIDFLGGDYRLQNVDVTYSKKKSDGKTLSVRGSVSGDVEKFEYSIDDDDIGQLKYNTDSGKLVLDIGDILSIEAVLESDESDISGKLTKVSVVGKDLEPDNLSISMSNDVKFDNFKGVEVLDIANADKSDWIELASDIKDGINDTGLKWYIVKYALTNIVAKKLLKWWF